jgi:transposase
VPVEIVPEAPALWGGENGAGVMVIELPGDRQDPFSGHVFCFRGRRGDLLKALYWDTQGMCLFAKHLEKGRFVWPSPADGVARLTAAQLGMLLEGIDWRMPIRTWRPEVAG